GDDGEPWFLATDVCKALGYAVSVSGVNHHLVGLGTGTDRITVNTKTLGSFEGIRGNPMRTFISERGLYTITMRAQTSRPEVAEFQKWVTGTVLPAIRKDGAYIQDEEKVATGELSEDEFILKAVRMLEAKVDRLTKERDAAAGNCVPPSQPRHRIA
ncbi:MAG: Bro-N domain-containing protein, partial [Vibrio fluvialis]